MSDDARHAARVDQAAAAVEELFGHLPDDELELDEPLELSLDLPGALVAVRSSSALYALRAGGIVLRYRRLGHGREEVVGFRDRAQVGSAVVTEGGAS